MAADGGGVYAGVASIIVAACTGFGIVYSTLRSRRKNEGDDEVRREAVRIAAEVLAEELLRRRFDNGELERRGWHEDDGTRRRHDD